MPPFVCHCVPSPVSVHSIHSGKSTCFIIPHAVVLHVVVVVAFTPLTPPNNDEEQVRRTEEMRAEARRFVSEVAHLPYKEGGQGLLQMVSAAFRFHPAKEERRRAHAETVA